MTYTSFIYYVLIIGIVIFYYCIPLKFRWLALLLGSCIFYYNAISNHKQLIVFCFSILAAYIGGLLINNSTVSKSPLIRKSILALAIVLVAMPLFIDKFTNLFYSSSKGKMAFSLIVPIGISFYTLQLVAYLVDIYLGKIMPQANPLKFVLFASFFPQIIQGPIPRYSQLSAQLFTGHKLSYNNITYGSQLIVWGFFLKYMIADKSAIVVNQIFNNQNAYSGMYFWVAAFLYSIQLYTDFLSCTTISQGVAQLFGINLADNFMHPYLATSIKDFWRRWHISLSSWLRDYIYIPLGGNRKGPIRKYLNIILTFTVSGLWHGSTFKYLFWGLLHGIYQIVGEIVHKFPYYEKNKWLNNRLLKQLFTFILVMLAWVIFRADSLIIGLQIIVSMFSTFNPWILVDDSLLSLGLLWKDWLVLLTSLIIMLIVSLKQEKGLQIRIWISEKPIVIRWIVYFAAIWTIWICGTYGYGFNSSDFIYGGF